MTSRDYERSSRDCKSAIRLKSNISKTAGDIYCYLATISITIVCCEAVRSVILATAWLLVQYGTRRNLPLQLQYTALGLTRHERPTPIRYAAGRRLPIGLRIPLAESQASLAGHRGHGDALIRRLIDPNKLSHLSISLYLFIYLRTQHSTSNIKSKIR